MFTRFLGFEFRILILLFIFTASQTYASEGMEESFVKPPQNCRPWVWWHWINGEISKEGIKADLEAMHDAGIGGAQIFDIGWDGTKEGKIDFMSPEWIDMFKYAVTEADRLGLEIGVNCSAGWANSGGPWNKIEDSMKMLVASKTLVQGPSKFAGPLPPRGKKVGPGNEYYKDIAVFAVNSDELIMKADKLESSVPVQEGMNLQGENAKPLVALPQGVESSFLFDFGRKVAPGTLFLRFTQVAMYINGEILSSDDGVKFKSLRKFAYENRWMNPLLLNLELDADGAASEARYFKVVMKPLIQKSMPELKETGLASLWFSKLSTVDSSMEKSGENRLTYDFPQQIKPVKTAGTATILDLSSKVDANGNLNWDIPAGQWTILRVGYTSTGRGSHPVRKSSRGLECDRLDPQAMDKHWEKMIKPLLEAAGSSTSFTNTLIDSYEVGGQNWGTEAVAHFKSLFGYDPTPWLPAVFGYAVGSKDQAERFLYDWRSNISSMMSEKYFGRFAELCKKNGLQSHIEPYMGQFECMPAGRAAAVPMGEFWLGGRGSEGDYCRIASSVAHVYGRNIVAAESFTSGDFDGGKGAASDFAWTEAPYYMKAGGDRQFCAGINKYILHSYIHQPFTDPRAKPGLTLAQFGSHFGRNQTWWPFAAAWTEYIARCQYLLRQGKPIADVCIFSGENEPNKVFSDRSLRDLKNSGYDYDVIGSDSILELTVKNGMIQVPSGASYRLLSVKNSSIMSVPVLKSIERILEAGGLVIASKPARTPGLSNYPDSEKELSLLADKLWGDSPAAQGERKVGKGELVWGIKEADLLTKRGIISDFKAASKERIDIGWVHRSLADSEIYFLSNQPDSAVAFDAKFRVPAKMKVQTWNPVNGEIQDVPVYSYSEGLCRIPLSLQSSGSIFVVFRKSEKQDSPRVLDLSFRQSSPQDAELEAGSLVITKAFYGSKDASKGVDLTEFLRKNIKDGKLDISVSNDALGGDPAPGVSKQLSVEYILDGKTENRTVQEFGRLSIISDKKKLAAPADSSCMLKFDSKAALKAVFSGNGKAELKLDSGKNIELECKGIGKALQISGPWKLSFPSGLGAPENAVFQTLMPLSESKEDGIKYFAGIVTYDTDFVLPKDFVLDADARYILSLGYPGEGAIAEIAVNGTTVGQVWTAPFELDVSSALKSGLNKLRVRVSTPWANRLIGDKQLSDDCKWSQRKLVETPDWLLNGTPRTSLRIAFVSYDVFNKDSKLRKSGLQGPVELRMIKEVPVKLQ